MKLLFVGICAVIVAAIALECVRNKDYEDGIFGRAALWFLFGCALARFTQIVGYWMGPYLGEGWAPPYIMLDNVETAMWAALVAFFVRHYSRFRGWRTSGKYEWRKSQKVA